MDEFTACECAYKQGYEKGLRDAARWIPVAERLPEPLEDILAYERTQGKISLAFSTQCGEWFGVLRSGEVTHWMPPPEPPKGE